MTAPAVSCVIPTRDRAGMVAQAVGSALAQGPDVEVIVVDDGSVDHTAKVLAGFGAAIRRLESGGVGVAAARNLGLAAARGGHVAFLDSDDLWLADKLGRQLEVMARRPELALTFTDYTVSEPDGAGGWRAIATRRFAGEPSLGRLLERNFVGTLTVMARRDALLEAGGFATALARGSDYDLWLRLRRRWPIARVAGVLADYRWHPDSLTGASRRRNTENYVDVIHRLMRCEPDVFAEAGASPALLLAAARERLAAMP